MFSVRMTLSLKQWWVMLKHIINSRGLEECAIATWWVQAGMLLNILQCSSQPTAENGSWRQSSIGRLHTPWNPESHPQHHVHWLCLCTSVTPAFGMWRIKGSKSSSSTGKVQGHTGLRPWNPAFKTTTTNAGIWGWRPPPCVPTWGGQQLLPFCWTVRVWWAFSRLRPSDKLQCFLRELLFSPCTVDLFPLQTSQAPPLSPSLITEQTSRKVESSRHSFQLPDLLD